MFRVCCLLSFLAIAACISSPEVTLAPQTNDATVSPIGSAERVSFIEGPGLEADDGGDLPHPEEDASAAGERPPPPPSNEPDDDADDAGDDDGKGKGKGKGKPPKSEND